MAVSSLQKQPARGPRRPFECAWRASNARLSPLLRGSLRNGGNRAAAGDADRHHRGFLEIAVGGADCLERLGGRPIERAMRVCPTRSASKT
jgi:hypothetical protein